jgi:Domain of unknown function (DUF4232)
MDRVGRTLAIAAAALLVVAAGCGSGSKSKRQAEAAGPAVPWSSRRPAELAPRAPAARACRGADLRADGQVKFVARLQGGIALVQLRNTGKTPCRLEGRPRVRFVKQGGPQQVQQTIPTTPARFPEVVGPPSTLRALRPGEGVALTVSWDNWCDPKIPGKPHPPPSAMRISLPGGRGHVDADYNAVTPCLDPSRPSILGVSRFQASLLPAEKPWSRVGLRASIPGQPLHARRGELLRFRVVLRNLDSVEARFERCPSYVEQLVPAGPVAVYRLNCKAAHPIPPGGREAFAFELRVPKGAPLGANGLFWGLDPLGARSPQLNARVLVEGGE